MQTINMLKINNLRVWLSISWELRWMCLVNQVDRKDDFSEFSGNPREVKDKQNEISSIFNCDRKFYWKKKYH